MQTIDCDFLVIGSGIAGLTFALKCARESECEVLVATKAVLAESNTNYAQGGVAVAIGEDDSLQLHVEDTLRAGAGLCDRKAVEFLVQHAEERIEWLIDIGAEFDRADSLSLSLGREGGHSRNRIVHRADQTGMEIERALSVATRAQKNIQILEHAFCDALAMKDGECTGAFMQVARTGSAEIRARAVCLATGSCCQVYRFTTNPPIATGDGLALADAAGAEIKNMEFIQFHPTTLYHRSKRGFLISEAVRGEGAILRNLHGRRFMLDYDSRAELAPRDIVARAIHSETLKEGVPFVYLDMTHIPAQDIQRKFPFISETLLSLGIDVTREPIPVVPAAHYQCGGVVTDLHGRTSIPGLYAAGEVACTGVHGANRLASNSLLEAVVFASSAAEHASANMAELRSGEKANLKIPVVGRLDADGVTRRLRRLMWENVGIVRKNRGLRYAREELQELIDTMEPSEEFYVAGTEARNLLACARLIIEAARARKTNVGLHYNEDLAPPQEEDGREFASQV